MPSHIERAQAQIESLIATGIPLSDEDRKIILERAEVKDAEEYLANIKLKEAFQEASLVAYSLDHPTFVMTVECRECKEKFQTNYRYQKYCSIECLRNGVRHLGLYWDPGKPLLDRWQGLPPTTILPETLKQLLVWAKELIRQDEHPNVPLPSPYGHTVGPHKIYPDPQQPGEEELKS